MPSAANVGDTVVAQAYQPIIRGYFAVAAAYYAVMSLTHSIELSGVALRQLGSAAIIACIVSAAACHFLRRPQTVVKLELVTSLVNLLVLTNVVVALHIEYSQVKLVYFVMLAMIFAFASVSIRQAIISILTALGGLFWKVAEQEAGELIMYGFVGFAAATSAIAIAYFLRRAISLAVSARQEADEARQYAETRLETAEKISDAMRLQSLSDSLTGLPNRRAFFDALGTCQREMGESGNAWLILLDLDGFKSVNDNHGHIMGDELLKAVSSRLRDYCANDAHGSRVGGDEFSIILASEASSEEVRVWCDTLLEAIAETYLIEDRLIQVSGSIGCYQFPNDEPDAKLIQKADFALLHAKKSGKNRVVLFEDEHAEKAAERFRIEQALRVADFEAEIELVFQPQFDLRLEQFVSAEALARWNSPIIGEIGPDHFIKIAEESGLIAKITVAVVDKAIAALQSWDDPLPVSINLSSNDLISDHIIDLIIQRLRDSELPAELIEFEVTETAMMSDTGRATANLLRLSKLGHSIALDDFGTGYSNFNYLRSLPINKLKVDRSFIENLADPMTEMVLQSLVGMARTLGVHCLLEGVESELDLVVAKRVGAQSVQGFLFGQPSSAQDLHLFISANNFEKIETTSIG
ncbi:EAL domain-containing protein [Altererythrobacter sp. ZODW24]|uniref:putative bifunctional diguanylate cyclase/phosphodiesterase n=1 Tax=Altererythrobacter sp. ZODW24 TaxID=2185142 RepID=UPI0013B45442|nr:EAL domain-containing protein [Altererythrobacter sp. ZODW24]